MKFLITCVFTRDHSNRRPQELPVLSVQELQRSSVLHRLHFGCHAHLSDPAVTHPDAKHYHCGGVRVILMRCGCIQPRNVLDGNHLLYSKKLKYTIRV